VIVFAPMDAPGGAPLPGQAPAPAGGDQQSTAAGARHSTNLRIGERLVGPGEPCYIVAEAGSTHGGDLGLGFELIDAAARAGANCVKFQVIFADEIVHPLTGSIDLPGGSTPIYERFRALERPPEFYARLQEHCGKRKVDFLASAFGTRSARLLWKLGVGAFKVASPELNHLDFLRRLRELAANGKPVVLSSGVSTLGDIERALDVCGPACVLLHCITAYPAPEEQYNLRVLASLSAVFGVSVGVSDHSLDPLLVPGAALLQGACLVEKHLTLSRRGAGLDDPVALEPEGFAALVRGLRHLEALGKPAARQELERQYGRERLEQVLGDGVKRLAPAEKRFYRTTRRSIHAVREIRAGQRIQARDLCVVRSEANLRPGLEPAELPQVIGAVAQRAIPAGQGVSWEDLLARRGPGAEARDGAGGSGSSEADAG
jgi:sialic acid synthase SpsE